MLFLNGRACAAKQNHGIAAGETPMHTTSFHMKRQKYHNHLWQSSMMQFGLLSQKWRNMTHSGLYPSLNAKKYLLIMILYLNRIFYTRNRKNHYEHFLEMNFTLVELSTTYLYPLIVRYGSKNFENHTKSMLAIVKNSSS